MPTLRQAALAKIIKKQIEERHTSISMYKAMKEAGYSESYACNPQQLSGTKGFHNIIKYTVCDEYLAKALQNLVNARRVEKYKFRGKITKKEIEKLAEMTSSKILTISKGEDFTEVLLSIPDHEMSLKAISNICRMRGFYQPRELEREPRELEHLTDEELDALLNEKQIFDK